MSLFAGVLALRGNGAIASHVVEKLIAGLSRHPGEAHSLVTGDGFAFVHADLGIHPGRGCIDDGAGVVLLAGAPLLEPERRHPRDVQVRVLFEAWRNGDTAPLAATHGHFCAAFYDRRSRRLGLTTDMLGLRPLYYAVDRDLLVFGTAMRMLGSVASTPLRGNLQALAEIVTAGTTFSDITPYENVRAVEPAHVVQVAAGTIERVCYRRWDGVGEPEVDEDTALEQLSTAFTRAVRRRLDTSPTAHRRVVSCLSGGLDSRVVVAALKEAGVEVHTINYAVAGSADLALGRLAAEALGTTHWELDEGPFDFWDRMVHAHRQWLQCTDNGRDVDHPAQLWTGFPGEAVIAPTDVTQEVLDAMRAGRVDAAIDAHLERVGGVPDGIFVPAMRARMRELPRRSLRAALERRMHADPARRFRLHLLLCQPRGALARHHNDLDLRRIELVTPFSDPEFVAVALAAPLHRLLRHSLYYRWLTRFEPAVSQTPWQAYPWSEPCPLPLPAGVRTQWPHGWFERRDRRRWLAQRAAELQRHLRAANFPTWLLQRAKLRIACWLARLGIERYAYLIDAALVFVRYAPVP